MKQNTSIMTIEAALDIITNATAGLNAPRAAHISVLQAIETLRSALNQKPEEAPPQPTQPTPGFRKKAAKED